MEELLQNIELLIAKARSEPDHAKTHINMIAKIITAKNKRKCNKCQQYMQGGDKMRKIEEGTGFEHYNCNIRRCKCEPTCRNQDHFARLTGDY